MFGKCCEAVKSCVDIIICVLTSLLTLVAGILIGGLTGLISALGLGAIIAILVLLAILLIIRIITLICCERKEKQCCNSDYDKYC